MKKESIRKLRLGGRLLLGIYLACLIYFMFFSESYGRTASLRHSFPFSRNSGAESGIPDIRCSHYNLVLFREIRRFVQYRHVLGTTAVLINVAGNVAVFVPLGFALPVLFERIHSFGQLPDCMRLRLSWFYMLFRSCEPSYSSSVISLQVHGFEINFQPQSMRL